MLTNAGSGYSTCRGLDVTRWREDSTRDAHGLFVYIRDVGTDALWSAGYQPTCRAADHYEAIFSADKVAFRRLDTAIETVTEITVSPESRAEIRRITLTNHDTRPRELELTSYAEVVLLGHGGDLSHPAFGKLFLETEWVASSEALICRRRPRSTEQVPVYAVHVAASDAPSPSPTQFETDRARFLGRGRSPADPAALDPGATLSGTTGAVLDPVFSLRRRVRIEPGRLGGRRLHHRRGRLSRGGPDPGRPLPRDLRRRPSVRAGLGSQPGRAPASQLVRAGRPPVPEAGVAHPPTPPARPSAPTPPILLENRKGQPGLWAYGISGDKPIVLAFIADFDEVMLASATARGPHLLAAQGARLRPGRSSAVPASGESGRPPSGTCSTWSGGSDARDLIDKPGGVYVRKLAAIPPEDRVLLQSYARGRPVRRPGDARRPARPDRGRPEPSRSVRSEVNGRPLDHASRPSRSVVPELLFHNGIGGFTPDGLEYRITIPASPRPDVRRNGKADRQNLSQADLAPGPLGQRHRQPGLRLHRLRRGVRATPGPATARPTGSPPGATTRSPTRPARSFTSGTRRPASSGRRPPCPSPRASRPWSATARVIRSSSDGSRGSTTS